MYFVSVLCGQSLRNTSRQIKLKGPAFRTRMTIITATYLPVRIIAEIPSLTVDGDSERHPAMAVRNAQACKRTFSVIPFVYLWLKMNVAGLHREVPEWNMKPQDAEIRRRLWGSSVTLPKPVMRDGLSLTT
jgi:hypothetical protein